MSNELYHYGVLGMRWGRRRYQNKDGSLTTAGRNRYSDRGYDSDVKYSSRKKMDKSIRKNWYKAYNKASSEFNSKIGELNRKFGADADVGNPKYVKTVGKLWKDCYSKQLIKDFGADPDTGAKDWVDNAPYMNMYDDFIED